MRLERKHAVVLLAIAVWNVVTWARFVVALATTDGRPTAYYVAHSVLIVVNLLIAVVLGRWGWRAWRATGSPTAADRLTAVRNRSSQHLG